MSRGKHSASKLAQLRHELAEVTAERDRLQNDLRAVTAIKNEFRQLVGDAAWTLANELTYRNIFILKRDDLSHRTQTELVIVDRVRKALAKVDALHESDNARFVDVTYDGDSMNIVSDAHPAVPSGGSASW